MANTGNITLYYIDGISRENTPYFSDYNVQLSWFATKAVSNLTDGFYVPHFQDTIVLSASDIGFATKVNYLSLLFNNKMYYYFIDSVTYLSETDLEIAISMDTIQTFMFNIEVHDSILERSHIARWTDSSHINRDYIRENLSLNVWYEPSYEYLTLSSYGMYIIRWTNTSDNDSKFIQRWYSPSGKQVVDFGFTQYLFVDDTFTKMSKVKFSNNQEYAIANVPQLKLISSITDPNCFNVVYVPFIPFREISIKVENNVPYIDVAAPAVSGSGINNMFMQPDSGLYQALEMGGMKLSPLAIDSQPHVDWKLASFTYAIPAPNTSIGEPYDSKYITQMYDSNYISVNFGERSYTASYPLHKATYYLLYFYYTADIKTGNRMYAISNVNNDTVFSEGAVVSTQTPLTMTMFNDAWQQWYAQNRATIPMALGNFALQMVTMGVGGTVTKQATESETLREGLSDVKKYRANKDSSLLTKYSKKFSHTKDYSSNYSSTTHSDGRIPNPGSVIDTATSAVNSWLAPDSIKQTSVATEDLASGGARNIFYELRVRDFEQVAFYYHRFGFLINKPYHSTYYMGQLTPLFTGLYTSYKRYYFNYYKFQYVDIDLTVMCSADMVDDVAERLVEGVRVWYVEHGSMCDYSYDNVEVSS